MGCGPRRALQRLLIFFFSASVFPKRLSCWRSVCAGFRGIFPRGRVAGERNVTAAVSGLQRSRARRTRQVRLVK